MVRQENLAAIHQPPKIHIHFQRSGGELLLENTQHDGDAFFEAEKVTLTAALVKISTFLMQVRLEALHSRLRLSCIMADKMSSTHKVSAFLLHTPCYFDLHLWVAGPGQSELPCGREAGGIPTRESRPGGNSHSMCHLLLWQLIHTYVFAT